MDLLQLEHFLAVVKERTFTRAADRVCRTQPAVSQSIKKLEEEIGAPLFARDVHEVSLTEAGRVLEDYAKRMVGLRDEAVRHVLRDLGSEQFVLHHLCSATMDRILHLFEQHSTRCRVVAELWSFENIRHFVQEEVGLAIVPRVTVRQELRGGTIARLPVRELSMARRTLMIYREQGYMSDAARELIKIVRAFNWDDWLREKDAPQPRGVRSSKVLRF